MEKNTRTLNCLNEHSKKKLKIFSLLGDYWAALLPKNDNRKAGVQFKTNVYYICVDRQDRLD